MRIYALPFYKSQNVFGQSKFFVPEQKFIHILWQCKLKRWFAFSKIEFCGGKKVFEEALNAVKFFALLKTFGPAQNILGAVKGQGISFWDISRDPEFRIYILIHKLRG